MKLNDIKKLIIILILFIFFSQHTYSQMYQKSQGNIGSLPANNNLGGGSGGGGIGGGGEIGGGGGGGGGEENQFNNAPATIFFSSVFGTFPENPIASGGDILEISTSIPENFGIRSGSYMLNEGESVNDIINIVQGQFFSYANNSFWVLTFNSGTFTLQYTAPTSDIISVVGESCNTPPDIRMIFNGVWEGMDPSQRDFPLILINCS